MPCLGPRMFGRTFGNGLDMQIFSADPETPEITKLLEEHMAGMLANSPPDACQFLNIAALKAPEVSFWAIRDKADQLMGCGAMVEYRDAHTGCWGEIKSMRTHAAYLRRGVAAAMLKHIISDARERQYSHLRLQTGTGIYFDPAHKLYLHHGFEYCTPFGDYVEDGFASYMAMPL